MANSVDYRELLDTIQSLTNEINEDQRVKILAVLLYPNEWYYSLTQTQLDRVRKMLNDFK